jgi:DNA-damage-inducible protein D
MRQCTSAELASNLFRATQTEEQLEKLRQRGMTGKSVANKTHFDIGRKVRKTIEEIGGTMPENYAAIEHVKEARNVSSQITKSNSGRTNSRDALPGSNLVSV